jgi:hypothetical protein
MNIEYDKIDIHPRMDARIKTYMKGKSTDNRDEIKIMVKIPKKMLENNPNLKVTLSFNNDASNNNDKSNNNDVSSNNEIEIEYNPIALSPNIQNMNCIEFINEYYPAFYPIFLLYSPFYYPINSIQGKCIFITL